jgi:hypothetical protein
MEIWVDLIVDMDVTAMRGIPYQELDSSVKLQYSRAIIRGEVELKRP